MTTWFISDTHFFHTNIIQYCLRPFTRAKALCDRCDAAGNVKTRDGDDWSYPPGATPCVHPDVDAMNGTIVKRWNDRVQPDDEVWHLGDLALGSIGPARELVSLLNGRKHLVLGNHDRWTKTVYRAMGFEPCKSAKLYVDGMRILMKHNPRLLDLTDYDLGLCGHIHERWREQTSKEGKRVINVGVDVRGFAPSTLAELLAAKP